MKFKKKKENFLPGYLKKSSLMMLEKYF